jgi:hypothetical protein
MARTNPSKVRVLRKKGIYKPVPSYPAGIMKVEILYSVNTSGLSDELRVHYKSHVLPLLKRLMPDGPLLHFAFLAEPSCIEIRRMAG